MLKRDTVLALLSLVLLFAGCGSGRLIPDDQYYLDKVVIRSDSREVDAGALSSYVRQKGNSRWFSLFKVPLGAYSLAGRDTTKWINRTLRRIGEKPVIYDSTEAQLSIADLRQAMANEGFMHATVDFSTKRKGKNLTAIYILRPGKPSYMGDVSYDIQDSVIRKVLDHYRDSHQSEAKTSASPLLRKGDKFSVNRLDAERQRITAILQDSGYYRFNKDFIQFTADSIHSRHVRGTPAAINLTVHILGYKANNDSPVSLHPRYRIGSVTYRGGNDGRLHLRRQTLEDCTELDSGMWYDATALRNTYNRFARLGAVRFTNIRLTERTDTAGDNTTERAGHLLDCDIHVTTGKPSTISIQPEGTNTAGDLGAALAVTYQNRNLFRGSELLSIQMRGAFEAIRGLDGYKDENYEEYSVEASLRFPRFIAPFTSKAFRRRSNATTEFSVSWDLQDRPEFHRRVFSAAWRYRWSNPRRNLTFRLDVPDLNYVYMPWISETFKHDYLDNVSNRNAILRYNYENLFITKVGFGVTYSGSTTAIRANIETSGNLLDGIAHAANLPIDGNGQYVVFNIPYAQYVKFDFDYTHLFKFDSRNTLVLHTDFGIAYPYGNSRVLPFEKRYFSGGANSVRGWSVRELGPGKFRGQDGRIDFINHTGDMKLDLNAEYRTSLFWKFSGALFVDAGNIWTLRDYPEQPGGQFKFSEFFKQIAVAYGLGLRLNFSYFILRFDMGMKAINPAYETNHEHYAILHPDLSRDFTFHFAVGMPF